MFDDSKMRKRSSLKHKNLFPENMSYEEYVALQKQKNIKWDTQIEDPQQDSKSKFKEANTNYIDAV
jgi:hypothetical protein